MKIGTSMQEALNEAFKNSCYSTIDFFQLRSGFFTITIENSLGFNKKLNISRFAW